MGYWEDHQAAVEARYDEIAEAVRGKDERAIRELVFRIDVCEGWHEVGEDPCRMYRLVLKGFMLGSPTRAEFIDFCIEGGLSDEGKPESARFRVRGGRGGNDWADFRPTDENTLIAFARWFSYGEW